MGAGVVGPGEEPLGGLLDQPAIARPATMAPGGFLSTRKRGHEMTTVLTLLTIHSESLSGIGVISAQGKQPNTTAAPKSATLHSTIKAFFAWQM